MLLLKMGKAFAPLGSVVIDGIEAFLVGLCKHGSHFLGVLCRLPIRNPRQAVAGWTIEIIHMRTIVREVWPVKVVKASGLDDRAEKLFGWCYFGGRTGARMPALARPFSRAYPDNKSQREQ